MNGIAVGFLAVSVLALLAVPRRWAALPLLAGACYMTVAQRIELGPFSFTVLRLLIAAGAVRVLVRGENLAGRWNLLDSLIVLWSLWATTSSLFHQDVAGTLVAHLGNVYNTCGVYFLLRCFCSSTEDLVRLCRITAILLVPVAAEMLYEHATFHNLFSVLGGVPNTPQLRDGRIRAFGPFTHPILAGTVGGVTLPLMLGIWNRHRVAAFIGIVTCSLIVVASASSGPLMSAAVGVGSVCLWPLRRSMRSVRWGIVGAYAALMVVMQRPPYYIIQKLEVVGGSTGWYRARLIESALEHLDEWWLAGTDYTRHWMTIATAIDEKHIDITNHYLALGVMGGLPLMLLFIACLVRGYSGVGRAIQSAASRPDAFFFWTLGASLTAHVFTCLSVSYFDQSVLFLYLALAAVASVSVAPEGLSAAEETNRVSAPTLTLRRWRPAYVGPTKGPAAPNVSVEDRSSLDVHSRYRRAFELRNRH